MRTHYNYSFILWTAYLARTLSAAFITPDPLIRRFAEPTQECVIGGGNCPSGSTCTQTETCGGICATSSTLPPQIPCTVGAKSDCPVQSTCTPTMICPSTGACGGLCIHIPTPPPEIPCTMGGTSCPTGSTCTPTMYCPSTPGCGGACIATPTPPPAPTPCVLGADDCGSSAFCTQTEVCRGLCILTPVATPPVTCDGVWHGRKWLHDCPCGSTCTPTETRGHHRGGRHFFQGSCIATPTAT